MSKTISVRIESAKLSTAQGERSHDLRLGRIPGYVDQSRSQYNSEIVRPADPQAVRDEISAHRELANQRGLKSDASVMKRGIITFGTEAQAVFEALSVKEQDQRFKDVALAVSRETGLDLLGLVVHRDEEAVHAHFFLRGYRYDPETGREEPSHFSKKDLSRLQDVAGACVRDLGITRGEYVGERVANGDSLAQTKHRSVRSLHRDRATDELAKILKPPAKLYATPKPEMPAVEKVKIEKNLFWIHERQVCDAGAVVAYKQAWEKREADLLRCIATRDRELAAIESRLSDRQRKRAKEPIRSQQLMQALEARRTGREHGGFGRE